MKELPILNSDEIHIWKINLNNATHRYSICKDLLATDEISREDKFVTQLLKQRYTLSRGHLRVLLSHYLQAENHEIQFQYNPFGKPFLNHQSGIQFNVSHSSEFAIFAFAFRCEVGIDIEYKKKDILRNKIEDSVLTAYEKAVFQTFDAQQKQNVFFQAWTCKEAILKGLGIGISQSLKEIELEFNSAGEVLRIKNMPQTDTKWCVHNIMIHPDYACALASNSVKCTSKTYDFSEHFY